MVFFNVLGLMVYDFCNIWKLKIMRNVEISNKINCK